MAVDTRDKRASAIGMHWSLSLPLANDDISQGDRLQLAGVYAGIVAVEVILWTVVTEDNTTTWTDVAENNTSLWTDVAENNTVTWSVAT